MSRSGKTNPLGKNEKRIDVPISEELEGALIAMASVKGIPKAEFARQLLEQAMFGQFSMLRKIAERDI